MFYLLCLVFGSFFSKLGLKRSVFLLFVSDLLERERKRLRKVFVAKSECVDRELFLFKAHAAKDVGNNVVFRKWYFNPSKKGGDCQVWTII